MIGVINGAGQVGSSLLVRDWTGAKSGTLIDVLGLTAPCSGVPGPPKFVLTKTARKGTKRIHIYPSLISWESGRTQHGNFATVKEPAANGAAISIVKPEPQGEEGAQ